MSDLLGRVPGETRVIVSYHDIERDTGRLFIPLGQTTYGGGRYFVLNSVRDAAEHMSSLVSAFIDGGGIAYGCLENVPGALVLFLSRLVFDYEINNQLSFQLYRNGYVGNILYIKVRECPRIPIEFPYRGRRQLYVHLIIAYTDTSLLRGYASRHNPLLLITEFDHQVHALVPSSSNANYCHLGRTMLPTSLNSNVFCPLSSTSNVNTSGSAGRGRSPQTLYEVGLVAEVYACIDNNPVLLIEFLSAIANIISPVQAIQDNNIGRIIGYIGMKTCALDPERKIVEVIYRRYGGGEEDYMARYFRYIGTGGRRRINGIIFRVLYARDRDIERNIINSIRERLERLRVPYLGLQQDGQYTCRRYMRVLSSSGYGLFCDNIARCTIANLIATYITRRGGNT